MLVMERDTAKRGTGTISEEKGPSQKGVGCLQLMPRVPPRRQRRILHP